MNPNHDRVAVRIHCGVRLGVGETVHGQRLSGRPDHAVPPGVLYLPVASRIGVVVGLADPCGQRGARVLVRSQGDQSVAETPARRIVRKILRRAPYPGLRARVVRPGRVEQLLFLDQIAYMGLRLSSRPVELVLSPHEHRVVLGRVYHLRIGVEQAVVSPEHGRRNAPHVSGIRVVRIVELRLHHSRIGVDVVDPYTDRAYACPVRRDSRRMEYRLLRLRRRQAFHQQAVCAAVRIVVGRFGVGAAVQVAAQQAVGQRAVNRVVNPELEARVVRIDAARIAEFVHYGQVQSRCRRGPAAKSGQALVYLDEHVESDTEGRYRGDPEGADGQVGIKVRAHCEVDLEAQLGAQPCVVLDKVGYAAVIPRRP